MLLLVDIGNQQTKWAWAHGPRTVRVAATTPTGELHKALLKILSRAPCVPHAVVACSVVPEATAALRNAVRNLAGSLQLFILDYAGFCRVMRTSVKPQIEPGADRLANALALRELYTLPACALDAGSALTLEIVDARGCFIGGAIAPGAALQLAALQQGTSQLGRIERLPRATPQRGTTTAAAMAIGIRAGLAGAACAFVEHVTAQLKQPPATIVVSGGDARLLLSGLRKRFAAVRHDPLLPLRGLACYYRDAGRNTQ